LSVRVDRAAGLGAAAAVAGGGLVGFAPGPTASGSIALAAADGGVDTMALSPAVVEDGWDGISGLAMIAGVGRSNRAGGRGVIAPVGGSAIAGTIGLATTFGRCASVMGVTPGRRPMATLKFSLVLSRRAPVMTSETQTMMAAMTMRKSSMRGLLTRAASRA
jgi:hypothetical protein